MRFWEQLSSAEILEDGKILRLVAGTSFIGRPSLGNTLMIRDCYHRLWEKLEADFGQDDLGRAVVGTPGQ